MNKYRIVKREYCMGISDDPANPDLCEMVTFYEVEVKSLFFWHNVKSFKRLITAVRLLHVLRQQEA